MSVFVGPSYDVSESIDSINIDNYILRNIYYRGRILSLSMILSMVKTRLLIVEFSGIQVEFRNTLRCTNKLTASL